MNSWTFSLHHATWLLPWSMRQLIRLMPLVLDHNIVPVPPPNFPIPRAGIITQPQILINPLFLSYTSPNAAQDFQALVAAKKALQEAQPRSQIERYQRQWVWTRDVFDGGKAGMCERVWLHFPALHLRLIFADYCLPLNVCGFIFRVWRGNSMFPFDFLFSLFTLVWSSDSHLRCCPFLQRDDESSVPRPYLSFVQLSSYEL